MPRARQAGGRGAAAPHGQPARPAHALLQLSIVGRPSALARRALHAPARQRQVSAKLRQRLGRRRPRKELNRRGCQRASGVHQQRRARAVAPRGGVGAVEAAAARSRAPHAAAAGLLPLRPLVRLRG